MQRQLCKAACNIALSLRIDATARTREHLTAAAAAKHRAAALGLLGLPE